MSEPGMETSVACVANWVFFRQEAMCEISVSLDWAPTWWRSGAGDVCGISLWLGDHVHAGGKGHGYCFLDSGEARKLAAALVKAADEFDRNPPPLGSRPYPGDAGERLRVWDRHLTGEACTQPCRYYPPNPDPFREAVRELAKAVRRVEQFSGECSDAVWDEANVSVKLRAVEALLKETT